MCVMSGKVRDGTPKLPSGWQTCASLCENSITVCFEDDGPTFLCSQSTMSSPPPHKTSHEVETISVQLQFRTQPANGNSKGAKKKPVGKLETKNKEITFTFELSEENYLSFLSALLKEHGHTKYTPVTKSHRFGVKVTMGAKKAYIFHSSWYWKHYTELYLVKKMLSILTSSLSTASSLRRSLKRSLQSYLFIWVLKTSRWAPRYALSINTLMILLTIH